LASRISELSQSGATESEEIGGGNHQAQFSYAMSETGGVSPPLEETEEEASINGGGSGLT